LTAIKNMKKTSANPIEPFYVSWWLKLREFPAFIHQGSANPPENSGGAAAFLISGGIGAVTMMVVHHLSDTSKTTESFVKQVGSWIPGAVSQDPMWGNIGSYAGKETFLLIGWLVSLAILYPLLREKQMRSSTIFFWLFSLYTLAAAMSWHPLFPYLPLQ
jgi:hypothetical protein